MSEHVFWLAAAAIKPGQLDNLRALMTEMVESTQQEVGTLSYEWVTDVDGTVLHVFERYADSAAVMVHMGTFSQKYAKRFMSAVDVTGFNVYGNPNDEVRQLLSGFGAVFFVPFGGFTR